MPSAASRQPPCRSERNQPVTRTLRRLLAGGVAAVVLAAVGALTGVGATTAHASWTVAHADHVELVVDWYEVPEAAADTENNNLEECRRVSELASWLLLVDVCREAVSHCAWTVDSDPRYRGHAIRVSFYPDQEVCSVIG
jgi:hypothetical protein